MAVEPVRLQRHVKNPAYQVYLAIWLGGIIVNLLTKNPPQFYDIALRDLGLLVGALALTRLAWAFRPSSASRTSLAEARPRAA